MARTRVVVTGNNTVGSVLRATVIAWPGAPTPTYQWQRDGVDISGETSVTYTLVSGDIGAAITCEAVVEFESLALYGQSSIAGAPVNTVAPVVSGSATVGSTLTTTNGTWTNSPTSYTYQWFWFDVVTPISGATSATYVPVTGDIGHTLTCNVAAINLIGSNSASSAATSAVVAALTTITTYAPIYSRVGLPSLDLDFGTTEWVTETSGKISAAIDKSNSAYDITQATDANRPVVNVNTLNGYKYLWSASPSFMATAASAQLCSASTGEWTAFTVYRVPATGSVQGVFVSQDATGLASRGNQMININASAIPGAAAFNDAGTAFAASAASNLISGEVAILSTTCSASAITVYKNGVAGTPTTITGTLNKAALPFRICEAGRGAGQYINGGIAMILVFPSALSDSLRQIIEGIIAFKYNIQSVLAAGHPYKTTPPSSMQSQYPSNVTLIEHGGNALQSNIYATPFREASGNMYAGVWQHDRKQAIVRSQDGGVTWRKTLLTRTQAGDDAHNVVSLGVDRNGFVHVCNNMHGAPMVYSKSSLAYDTSVMTPINTMTGVNETQVTYPQFYNFPDTGQLLFVYRDGVSGNGTVHMNVYDEATSTWSRLGGIATTISGASGPYINTLSFDASGNIYMTWTNRTGGSTNSNVYYAKYLKASNQWVKRSGAVYPLPIVLADEDLLLTTNARNMNQNSSFLDSSGTLHVAFMQDDLTGNTQLHHISVTSAGVTTTTQVSNLTRTPVTAFPDYSRPTIYSTPSGAVEIIFGTGYTSNSVNYVNTPGDLVSYTSADGLTGAAWGSPVKHPLPRQISEFNLDHNHFYSTGNVRWYMQHNQATGLLPAVMMEYADLWALPTAAYP